MDKPGDQMRTKPLVLASLAVVATVALSACGSASGSSTASGGGASTASGDCKYKVGYAEPTAAQEIDSTEDKALIAAGKQAGICVTVVDSALDVNKQLEAVNQFVAQKMDAIIVFPLSPNSLNPALQKAHDAGIKVIGTSAVVTDSEPTGSIAPYDALYEQNSDVDGAHLLAGYVKSKLPNGGNVVGVGIGVPVPSLQFMVKNYQKYVTEGSSLKWLATVENPSDDIAGGQQVVGQAVTRFQGTKVDAVMAYNTSSAVGAYQALQTSGSKNAVIVGQNGDKIGIQALQSGQLDAVVDLMPWRSALMIIDLTKAVLTGGSYPKLTFGRVEMYTKDTLSKRLDWTKAIDEISAGTLTCTNGGGCPTGAEATVPF